MTENITSYSIADFRARLSEFLGEVFYAKRAVRIEHHGKPMAVLVSPEEYRRFRRWLEQCRAAGQPTSGPGTA